MGCGLLNEGEEVHGKPEDILGRAAQIRGRDVSLCLVNKRLDFSTDDSRVRTMRIQSKRLWMLWTTSSSRFSKLITSIQEIALFLKNSVAESIS